MIERKRVNTFCCYAHEDLSLLLELQTHLKPLERDGYITLWSDTAIRAGNVRQTEIDNSLNEAQLILLLVSPDFMVSDSCYNIEMRRAMERHELGEARVIPIILRPVDWEYAPFGKLQALPTDKRPITGWPDQDEALLNVVKGIQRAVEKIKAVPNRQSARQDNLPSRPDKFLGRKKERARALQGLRRSSQLISIVGMGGVGKTTLALHIAHSCLPGPQTRLSIPFDYVVWVSAEDRPKQQFWLNEIVDTIAEVLGYPTVVQLPAEQEEQKKEKIKQIDRLLREHRTLVVVDNFETMDDDLDLKVWIERIPMPSKILVTSRSNQFENAWNTALEGLDETSALKFIREYFLHQGLRSIGDEEEWHRLIRVTQGNPLAIKLALRHVLALGVRHVVDDLCTASGSMRVVFHRLFSLSWMEMDEEAKDLLMATSFFADDMDRDALSAASGLTSHSLDAAIIELGQLMLLDNRDPTASTPRYSIHPLTRTFARAKIEEKPDFEEQARMRWCEYYIKFVGRSLFRHESRQYEFKQPYWNALPPHNRKLIDPEWSNLQEVLVWADQHGQDQVLVELILLLAHYMCARMLFSARISYSQKAAEAATRLGRREDAALLHIDGSGWILLEEGRLIDAREEIVTGLRIAESLDASSTEATDLIALANTWLAAVALEQEDLAGASALMDKVGSLECKPVIQYRVHLVAGDIEYRNKNIVEARRLYESAYQISLPYGGESVGVGVHARLGDVYLASGDLRQAETYFNEVLDMGQSIAPERIPHAKYGLARVALARGERDKARQLAHEAWNDLSRTVTSHRLLSEIHNFLEGLGTFPQSTQQW